MKKIYYAILLSGFCAFGGLAQQRDSLAGFDENAAIRSSVTEGFNGSELRVHLAGLQRNYIKQKFNLSPNLVYTGSRPAAAAACVNEDFEASSAGAITNSLQINGWEVTRGYNTMGNNNCNLSGCCPSAPVESSLVVTPSGFVDPIIGAVYPLYSVYGSAPASTAAAAANPQITFTMGGNNFIRLNSSNTGDYSVERLSKSFTVTATNNLFSYAFVAVTAPGHGCCDAGAVRFIFTNVTTSSVLATSSYSVPGFSSACSNVSGVTYLQAGTGAVYTSTSSSAFVFNKWKVGYVDLSPYMGNVINISVIAGDCTAGGHSCYAYFDSQCGAVDLQVNNQPKNVSCQLTATVAANPGLNAYMWNGPNNFTSSASSFTTTTAGVYTLVVPQDPPLQGIQKTMSLVISPASVTVSATASMICKGQPVTLTASGLTTYSWSNGSINPTFSVMPMNSITYTLTGKNVDDCPAFAIQAITVSECTGLRKLDGAMSFNLFPNPNSGVFSFEIKGTSAEHLLIVNEIGQLVFEQKVHEGLNQVKTTLEPGLYHYLLKNENSLVSSGKFRVDN